MALFQRYQLERNGDSYTIILYLDPGLAEFADEFGNNTNGAQDRLADSVRRYVKERFPNLKVTAAKVMLGSFLAASIPLGGVTAQAAEAPTAAETQVQAKAELADVVGTKFESSVKMLQALGVIEGFPDGTYKPNQGLTRAEFAKIAVYAAGYGDTAEILGAQNTGFTDVPASHWASKYILVAKERGLMEGIGYNKFNPDAPLTYEQVVTVLQRIQGYNDDGLVGTWPTNHVIQATQQGIISNTSFKVGEKASRGDLAILLRNVLEKPMVKYNSDTKRFENVAGDKTLLAEAFGDSFKSGIMDTANGKFQISYIEKIDGVDTTKTLPTEGIQLTLIGANSINSLLGHEVSFMKVSDNHYLVMDNQDPSKIISGKLKSQVNFATAGADVQFEGSTTVYDNGNTAPIFYKNGKKVSATTVNTDETVTIILDKNNQVRFVNIMDYENPFTLTEIIPNTPSLNGSVKGTDKNGAVNYIIDKDNPPTVIKNGKASSLSALTKDDVVYVALQDNKVVQVEAYSNIVTGTVTMLKSGNGNYVQIDGVDYKISDFALDDSKDVTGTADYAVGKKYSFVLDKEGKIIKKFVPAGEDPTKVTGMFLSAETIGKVEDGKVVNYDAITVLTSDGAQKTYLISKATGISSSVANGDITITVNNTPVSVNDAAGEANPADIVELSLDKDGNVIGATVFDKTATDKEINEVTATELRVLESAGTIKTYRIADDIIIYDQDNQRVLSKDQLKKGYTISYTVSNNGIYVNKIVVTDGTADLGVSPAIVGLYKGSYTETTADNVTRHYVTLQVGNEERNIEVAAATTGGFTANDVNKLVKLTDSDDADAKYDAGAVITGAQTGTSKFTTAAGFTVDSAAKTFAQGTEKYVLDADSKVYVVTMVNGVKQVSVSDIAAINAVRGTAGVEITVVAKTDDTGNAQKLGDFTRVDSVIVDQTTVNE